MSTNINFENIHSVEFDLLDGQVDLVLRALESYAANLEFIMKTNNISNEVQEEKLSLLKCTYEQILTTQAEQVESKRSNLEHIKEITANIVIPFELFKAGKKEAVNQ